MFHILFFCELTKLLLIAAIKCPSFVWLFAASNFSCSVTCCNLRSFLRTSCVKPSIKPKCQTSSCCSYSNLRFFFLLGVIIGYKKRLLNTSKIYCHWKINKIKIWLDFNNWWVIFPNVILLPVNICLIRCFFYCIKTPQPTYMKELDCLVFRSEEQQKQMLFCQIVTNHCGLHMLPVLQD